MKGAEQVTGIVPLPRKRVLRKSFPSFLGAVVLYVLSGTAASAAADLSLVGPVEHVNCRAREFSVLGVQFSAGRSPLFDRLCARVAVGELPYVALTGKHGENGHPGTLSLLSNAQADAYVPGASGIYIRGEVSAIRPDTGDFAVAGIWIRSIFGELPAVGQKVEILGTQPSTGGLVLATHLSALISPNSDPNTRAIIGSGKSTLAIIGSGRQTSAIIGSGKSASAIIGSGRSTSAIIGSGRQSRAIIGSGAAAQAITGSGLKARAIIDAGTKTQVIFDSGRQTNAIIGSGATAQAIIGSGRQTSAIIGSGASARAIIGSGRQTNAIIGSGASAEAIIGSGRQALAIIGSGVSSQAIIGSGASAQAIIGSGRRANAIIGSGML